MQVAVLVLAVTMLATPSIAQTNESAHPPKECTPTPDCYYELPHNASSGDPQMGSSNGSVGIEDRGLILREAPEINHHDGGISKW